MKFLLNLFEPRLRLGEGFIGYVAQTGEPLISADAHNDPRYFHAREKTRSEMVAPIVANDEGYRRIRLGK